MEVFAIQQPTSVGGPAIARKPLRPKNRFGRSAAGLLVAVALAQFARGAAQIEAVSVVDSSLPVAAGGSGDSENPILSSDGRFVGFSSDAGNLVTNVMEPFLQAYVRDRKTGTTLLASVGLDGLSGGDGEAIFTGISADGRVVVFESRASNLVTNQTSGLGDVYVRDLVSGVTTLVSVSPSGAGGDDYSTGASITPDGRLVVFESMAQNLVPNDSNQGTDIFVRNLANGTTTLVSVDWRGAQSAVFAPAIPVLSTAAQISPDGRYVLFQSYATNLVTVPVTRAGASTFYPQTYLRDLQLGTSFLASADSAGNPANRGSQDSVLSSDAHYVVFSSTATNLTAQGNSQSLLLLFRKDMQTADISLVSSAPLTEPAAISADGGFIAYASTNQIYLWDQVTGSSSLVSTNSAGEAGAGVSASPLLSADGKMLVFISTSSDLADPATTGSFQVFGHENVAGVNKLLSATPANPAGSSSDCLSPSLSPDGAVVAFQAFDTGLFAADNNSANDIFAAGTTGDNLELISSVLPALASVTAAFVSTLVDHGISDDGRYVLYWGVSDNLTAHDTNGGYDVILRDTLLRTNILVSANLSGTGPGDGNSDTPVMSPDGRYVAFWSTAHNLVDGHTNTSGDVYVRDVIGGTTKLASIFPFPSPVVSTVPAPANPILISQDGQYVAFVVATASKKPIALRDFGAGATLLVPSNNLNQSASPLAFTHDGALWYVLTSLQVSNIVRYDIASRTSEILGTNAAQAAITPDGRFLVGQTVTRTNQTIWRYDRSHPELGVIQIASLPAGSSAPGGNPNSRWRVALSADARFVVFVGADSATNTVSDIFLADAQNPGVVSLVSSNQSGVGGGDGASDDPSMSADGRYVTFRSAASNLVPGDNNGKPDIFVRDLQLGTTTLVSATPSGAPGNDRSFYSWINPPGTAIAFESAASDLVAGDYNELPDVFLYHLPQAPPLLARVLPVQLGLPVSIVWNGEAGKNYQVQFKDSLSDAVWSVVPATPAANGAGEMVLQDSGANSSHQRFYRVVQEP